MTALVIDPHIIDLVLAVFVLEAAVLFGYRHVTGKGLAPGQIAANLLSGAMIMVALRLALSGAPMEMVAPCLLASMAAHIADLAQR